MTVFFRVLGFLLGLVLVLEIASSAQETKTKDQAEVQKNHKADSRPETATEIESLKKVFNKMWISDSVQYDVQKIVVNALLDSKKVYSGKFYFSKGLVRVDFVKPSVSKVVIDSNYIWHAQKLPEDFGGWQVSRIKKSLTSKSQALLNLMFGDQLHWDKLTVKGVSKKIKPYESYVLVPKSIKDFPGITKLVIVIDTTNQSITRVRQVDDVDNEVVYDFSNQTFDKFLAKKFFSYKPPKDAEVSYFD